MRSVVTVCLALLVWRLLPDYRSSIVLTSASQAWQAVTGLILWDLKAGVASDASRIGSEENPTQVACRFAGIASEVELGSRHLRSPLSRASINS